MHIIVQKFGGTSVATKEARSMCVKHVKRELAAGNSVVVVVSAIGRKGQPYATDTLLSLLDEGAGVSKREKDLLLSTGELISASIFSSLLNQENIENVVLTGGQAGIITNNNFGTALIIDVDTSKITAELKRGKVVIVPGFQGKTTTGEITTLGRGGSDTSAAAIGVGLGANCVDIYTDVDGMMTADPRVVEKPIYLKEISFQDVVQMAYSGASVIHPRAVELAMNHDVTMRIRSTFTDNVGTTISKNSVGKKGYDTKEVMLSGIVSNSKINKFTIKERKEIEFGFDALFEYLQKAEISIDFINVNMESAMFTVTHDNVDEVEEFLIENEYEYKKETSVSKIAIVGHAINGVPGIMSRIVQTLNKNRIEILQTSDSNTTIWLLVDSENEKKAVQTLHDAFFENR